MRWSSYLRTKTRQSEFLWRMVIWIIAVGIFLGYAAQQVYRPVGGVQSRSPADQSETKENWKRLETLAENSQWRRLWWAVPRVAYQRIAPTGATVLAMLTGCCWLAFLLQGLKPRGARDWRLWCAGLALPLGVLSIWPTHFTRFWQEHVWNLRESSELVPGVTYFVLSVGLREELAKLLCLLPLMPILLRLRSELAALLVSACVGLGFAIVENINYFTRTGGAATLGRFLLANPMHMTLTGLAGLALYRGLRSPRDWGPHALSMVGLMVIAHGLYDAFIAVPALAEYGLFSTIVFALVVYQFFRELRDLRPSGGDMISLSANFLCGVSLLTAATFIYLSATQGCLFAMDMLVQGVIGLAVMVYLFLREMPESMIQV